MNGKPYQIGSRQPQNTIQPSFLSSSQTAAPFLDINQHTATLQTGCDTLVLSTSEPADWHVEEGYSEYVSLSAQTDHSVTLRPTNNTDETVSFCAVAATADGREAACYLIVKPSQLAPPTFKNTPRIVLKGNELQLSYHLNLQGRRDESLITWSRNGIPVAVSHVAPQLNYLLTEADQGQQITATIMPKHQRSNYGSPYVVRYQVSKKYKCQPTRTLSTDFSNFPCQWQPVVKAGYWTVDGNKPADTASFPWAFDDQKPMWEYAQGFNGAVGMGLLQAQRGARLMYTPMPRSYGKMSLVLEIDPTKTAGQGFGSATGQYMDVCLKFDTQRLTGYGLRIIRTTKHAKAVDFLLVRYDEGRVTPISDPVSATCYRTGCRIFIDFTDNQLSAYVTTKTPRPSDSTLPHEVRLKADVSSNPFGGIHLQHTGSCGESTTMLHQLCVSWY